MARTVLFVIFALFIAVLVFNDPLNKRHHSFYEDQQQEIADELYGKDENMENTERKDGIQTEKDKGE